MIVMNPYLIFIDTAEDALNFYHSIFGGEVSLSRFKEMADTMPAPVAKEHEELLVHGLLKTNDFQLMVSDSAPTGGNKPGDNVYVSLSGDDDTMLSRYFEALSTSGKITLPLETAPWGDKFGMLTDQYGIGWMVNITAPKS